MNLYLSTYSYTHSLETFFRGFNPGPNATQNGRIPVWEMTSGTKGCARIVRLAAMLHHSKRHKHWKLLAVGLDLPGDSGKAALMWVTLFKAEFCNISLVAVVGHVGHRLTAWSEKGPVMWILSGTCGCGNVTFGPQIQRTAGGSLEDSIAFTFTTIHLQRCPNPWETRLGSRAAQQCVWAHDVRAHQLCTLFTAAPRQ